MTTTRTRSLTPPIDRLRQFKSASPPGPGPALRRGGCGGVADADAEFSRRSVCNRSVTATHPAVHLGLLVASREVTEEIRR